MSTMTIQSVDQYGKVSVTTVDVPPDEWVPAPEGRYHRIVCPVSVGSERESDIFKLLHERSLREGVTPGKCPSDATITAVIVKPPA